MPTPDHWWALVPGAEAALVLTAFAWGATLGSFLNVVLHRVPRGASVVAGGSRCPRCGAGIRPSDNVPIIGWILLRGRCRDCGLPISPRYPLVEAACGVLAAIVAVAGLGGWLSSGSSGPAGVDRLLLHGEWRLIVSWALHTAVLLALFTWTMLAADGMQQPCHRAAIILAATIVIVAAIPEIGPLGVGPDGAPWPSDRPRLAAVTAATAGAAVGLLCGRMSGGSADPCSFVLVGAVLGWQAAVCVAVVTSLGRAARAFAGPAERHRWIDPAIVVIAATLTVACRKPLAALWAAAWHLAAGS